MNIRIVIASAVLAASAPLAAARAQGGSIGGTVTAAGVSATR